jgi:hypothetical protein
VNTRQTLKLCGLRWENLWGVPMVDGKELGNLLRHIMRCGTCYHVGMYGFGTGIACGQYDLVCIIDKGEVEIFDRCHLKVNSWEPYWLDKGEPTDG